jgi:hypothetical protein
METTTATSYELRFISLFQAGRALAFPCDEQGRVPLEALPPAARGNFQRAQQAVGREWATPAVHRRLRGTH